MVQNSIRRSAIAAALLTTVTAGQAPAMAQDTVDTGYPASWQVPFRPSVPLPADYQFGRQTTILKKGSTFPPAAMALPCDIQWDRDVPIKLRDGVTMYTDVLRPVGGGRVPAIVAWSPYGKTIPAKGGVSGVSPGQVSGLAKGEGPEPAFWVCHGYAVVNPDPRGANKSEGNIHFWGSADGRDGYDAIEWIAQQPWSNGKVGLHGTSWLAMTQWHIAAANPPHLAAIAPWNGLTDPERNEVFWGGIPNFFFMRMVGSHLTGEHLTERPDLVVEQNPMRTPYWEDKAAPLEKISVPAYVVTDFVTDLHRMGTAEGFRRLGSKEKWFRVDPRNEWADQYDPLNEEDLLKFFDHYLKGANNGWEKTPRVRISVLDPGGATRENVPYSSWPVAGTRYTQFYLSAGDNSLGLKSGSPSTASFDAQAGSASFTMKFDKETQVTGYVKARLWVETKGADDEDVFLLAEKLDANGNVLVPSPEAAAQYFPVPPAGSQGRLRISMRELDPAASTSFLPVLKLAREQKVAPGEVVPLDIAILPMGVVFHPGEQLRLVVAGKPFQPLPLAGSTAPKGQFARPAPPLPTVSKGSILIHTGGEHASYLQLPLVGR